MKTKPLTFLLALTFLFLFSGSTTVNAKQKFGDYEGAIYVRNYDGDTITFNLPNLHPIIGKKIRVRLNGIDTPEIKGKCDKEKYDAERIVKTFKDSNIQILNSHRGPVIWNGVKAKGRKNISIFKVFGRNSTM